MALEPITRQEQIIAGKDLEPITRMEKFLKEYGGGGGASSWNDLDDKPFGELTFTKTMSGTYTYDAEQQAFPLDFALTAGSKYALTINGENTELLTAQAGDIEGVPTAYLGNAGIMGMGDNTEENYFIVSIPAMGITMGALADTSVTEMTLTVDEYAVTKLQSDFIDYEPVKKSPFYIGGLSDMGYLYIDRTLTTKASAIDVIDAIRSDKAVVIQFVTGGIVAAEMYPSFAGIQTGEYSSIQVIAKQGNSVVALTYVTAEYTG